MQIYPRRNCKDYTQNILKQFLNKKNPTGISKNNSNSDTKYMNIAYDYDLSRLYNF